MAGLVVYRAAFVKYIRRAIAFALGSVGKDLQAACVIVDYFHDDCSAVRAFVWSDVQDEVNQSPDGW